MEAERDDRFMAIGSFAHRDRFLRDHVAFWIWMGLYVTTPILVPAAWIVNRRTDPGTPEPGESRLSAGIRATLIGAGAVMMGRDGRPSAIRVTLHSQVIGLALILVAVARAWDSVDSSNGLSYVLVAGLAALLVGLVALWVHMRRPESL